jgi:16S rRNA (uracil1498-N3)-methyltransferase
MIRRIHATSLKIGTVALDARQTHHLRDVLRLEPGEEVELFDDAGSTAKGVIIMEQGQLTVQVQQVEKPPVSAGLIIASAVPKGERADWMVEKLSELGVSEFIPLLTQRSVVHPQGEAKMQRWQRLATESAKQCRRNGVMRIGELTKLPDAISRTQRGWYLSTQGGESLLNSRHGQDIPVTLFIGPEGGWTEEEIQLFTDAQIHPARLTQTILRIETAAIAAAAIVLSRPSQVT